MKNAKEFTLRFSLKQTVLIAQRIYLFYYIVFLCEFEKVYQHLVLRISSQFPNTKKLMKARGHRDRFYCFEVR